MNQPNLPIEIVRYILAYVSIELVKNYVLRRTETHPICMALTHLIDTKWKLEDDYLSAYDNHETWDERDVLQYYQGRGPKDFVYKNCGVISGFVYIRILCVRDGKIVHFATQKYGQRYYGYIDGFICESINVSRKTEQHACVYYSKMKNEMDPDEKRKRFMEYSSWTPEWKE